MLVVDAILLATGDAKLHLEEAVDLGKAGHVLGGELDVLVQGLLRQVDHMRGEKGLLVGLEVLLIGLDHAVEPGEELLGAVVRVEHNGHAICLGHVAHVVGALRMPTNRQSVSSML